LLRCSFPLACLLSTTLASLAQMPMNMPMSMGGPAASFSANVLRHDGSGTDLEAGSGAPPMLMRMTENNWMFMLHGNAMAVDQHQSGLRGHDKFFSVNWFMPMAQRTGGSNQITLRTMLSLEPATITGRYYPELFQQGETAYGKPIVDGQHPHNLFMEIAALYDRKLGEHILASLYGGPVGDPALGPEAFPHRPSASENPLAPLGHHLEDSTHIADDVLTGGIAWAHNQTGIRLEASGFHGREPDENRWHIEVGAVDSWAARLAVAPHRDIVAQYSLGRLHSPEAVHPSEDVLRQTASVSYHHTWQAVALDATGIWGRNHTIGSAEHANGYLGEATARIQYRHIAWTRIESVDRTSDLLGLTAPMEEFAVGRVQAYTGGYAHRLWNWRNGSTELGAQITGYATPSSLTRLYGSHPMGVAAIFKVQLGREEK
jgi:hypothetical protein